MQAPRVNLVFVLIASTTCFAGCAHTKPLGQTLVALGALAVGLSALDAAGVLGSKCTDTTTPQGETVASCSGNSVVPQPVNVLGIVVGAGLIGGGVALWAADSPATPPAQPQTSSLELVPTLRASQRTPPQF